MKICISSTGKALDAMIDQRFGRCQFFLIVDSDTMNVQKIISNEGMLASGGAGIQAAQIVTKENVEAVITGNIGPNAFQILQAANVNVFTGAEGTIKDAIDQCIKGKLHQTASATAASHAGLRGRNI